MGETVWMAQRNQFDGSRGGWRPRRVSLLAAMCCDIGRLFLPATNADSSTSVASVAGRSSQEAAEFHHDDRGLYLAFCPEDEEAASIAAMPRASHITRRSHITPRIGLAVLVLTGLLALLGMAGSASAATSCSEVPTVYGIPPWGFHTGPYTGGSSFAKGHGEINLEANTVSGIMCQQDRAGTIIMSVEHHLSYHSHYAMMWGYPGNIMKIKVRVTRSTDTNCAVGTVGSATLFASYNGVRSDSVQFFFPAACRHQDHLYHGTEVNNQVPPL